MSHTDMETDAHSSIGSEPFEILNKMPEDGGNTDTDAPPRPTPAVRSGRLYPRLPSTDSGQPAEMQTEGASSPSSKAQNKAPREATAEPPQAEGNAHLTEPKDLPPLTDPHFSDPLGASAKAATPEQVWEPEREDREYRILIIGKTGNGKSSLANTITGSRNFKVGRGMFSTTREAQAVTAEVMGKRLKVIDTPDLTNLMLDKTTAMQRISKWKELSGFKPDVIIQVVRCDVRYTREEHAIYLETQALWKDMSLFRQRLMVAFTFGDLQDQDLEEELETVNEELKSVLRDAKRRIVQVNNRAKGEEKTQQHDDIFRVLNTVIGKGELRDESQPVPRKDRAEIPKEVAVVLVGKTGHGKSSVGNLLIGTDRFPVATGPSTVTRTTDVEVVMVAGGTLKVIDTPDLQNLNPSSKNQEETRLKDWTSGLHVVVLFVVRCDVRFTPDELAIYHNIKKLWGDNRVIVVFTFKDRLDFDLEELMTKQRELNGILKDKGIIWVAVNNKAQEREKREDVNRLLADIETKAMETGVVAPEQPGPVAAIRKKVSAVTDRVPFINKCDDDQEATDESDHSEAACIPHSLTARESSREPSWCPIV